MTTDPETLDAVPVGAYVASSLMASKAWSGDYGEDVDRFLGELAKRGFQVVRDSLDVERLATAIHRTGTAHPNGRGIDKWPDAGCDWCNYETKSIARAYAATPPSPAPEGEPLREALEQARDRMETAWNAISADVWSESARTEGGVAETIAQALYFGVCEVTAALAATPAPEVEP